MQKEEFFNALKKTKEGQEYLDLVEKNQSRKITKESGYEIHHIFPRCFGGTNEASNLVKLTVKEHLLAHYYLVQSISHPKLLYSFSFILGPQFNKLTREDQISLESLDRWSELREKALHRKLTDEHRYRIGEANRGKLVGTVRSRESVEKGIRTRTLRGHNKHSPETIEKIRRSNTGKRRSEEYRQRMSDLKKGCIGSFRGKTHSKESNQKNRIAHLGRVHINDGIHAKMVFSEDVSKYLQEGWKLGRIYRKKSRKSEESS